MNLKNYKWDSVHNDLLNDNYAGSYGADNISYHALTEAKHNINLNKCHQIKHKDEHFVKSF